MKKICISRYRIYFNSSLHYSNAKQSCLQNDSNKKSCFCIYLQHNIITYSLNSLVTLLGLFYFVFYYISNIYYISSLSAHSDWTVRMMHDVVTDWTQDSSPDASHASGSHHDHVGFVLQGRGHYRCSGVVTICSFVQTLLYFLQEERKKNWW